MAKVAICSMFSSSIRNGSLFRYMHQVDRLDWPKDLLRVYAVEGDSEDVTLVALNYWARHAPQVVRVVTYDLGHRPKASVEDEDRMVEASMVAGYCRHLALDDHWADYIMWIESDLIWGPNLLRAMIRNVQDQPDAYWAPWIPIEARGTAEFDYAKLQALSAEKVANYDIWAYRTLPEGERIRPDMARFSECRELYSAGSCLTGRRSVVALSNSPGPRAIVGWCEQAREAGSRVMCDPTINVWHPAPRQR